MFKYSAKRLLVCDMAGTTVQERGIVYSALYQTIKIYNIDIYYSWVVFFCFNST